MKLSQTQRDQALQERDAARQQVEATICGIGAVEQ